MPDGDKFEWQLYGKGLRRAYRLARGFGEIGEIAQLLYYAKNELIRNGYGCSSDVIAQIVDVVCEALNRPLFSQEENVLWLFRQLDQIAASQNYSRGTLIATEAAKSVFAQISSNSNGLSRESVKKSTHRKFTEKLLDAHFFSIVRNGIMNAKKRTPDEQTQWEDQVSQKIISFKRSSNQWASVKTWDKEQLFQPIAVLEG